MSVLQDITSGWNKKTPSNTDTEGNPPQAGSVAKQVVSEYDASAGNNATVKGIVPTSNADGTVNTTENQPVYNVKEDASSKYNLVNQLNNNQPVVSPQPAEPTPQPSYTSPVDNFIKNYTPESEQQKAFREKRERRNKLFTSIADGLSAITNIAGATGGAKNANPNNISLTKAYQSRLDQFKQARKENEQKYLYYLQKKEEEKRQADAAAWDRAKFIADQNYKESESQRDQSNKDREYDRNVNNDKSNIDFKKLDNDYKKGQLKETTRHNHVEEGIGSVNAKANVNRSNKEGSDSADNTWSELYNRYKDDANDYEHKYNIGEGNGSYFHQPTSWTADHKKTFVALMKQKYGNQHPSSNTKNTNSTPSTHSGKKGLSNTKALGL